ncbi:hypothetical protein MMC26_002776 [Xylographa opegraphella]|nr:hypothetical protein [Xylographa opegraphella]
MATWRDQKFVPDSDDEDEELDFNELKILRSTDGQDPATSNSSDRQDNSAISANSVERESRSFRGSIDTVLSRASSADRNTGKSRADVGFDGLEHPAERKIVPNAAVDLTKSNVEVDTDELSTAQSDQQLELQRSRPQSTPKRLPKSLTYYDVGLDELQQYGDGGGSPISPGMQLTSELLQQVYTRSPSSNTDEQSGQILAMRSTISSPLSESSSTALDMGFSQRYEKSTLDNAGASPLHTKHSLYPAWERSLKPNGANQSSTNINAAAINGPARSLRQRNPIQLHPYLLEGEQYRKALQARGIKPLRIYQQAVEQSGAGGLMSQDQTTSQNEDDQAMSSDLEPVTVWSSIAQLTPIKDSGQHLHQSSHDEEDEFPDVRSLLCQPSNIIVDGNKRRKVAHTFSKKGRGRALGNHRHASLAVVIDSSVRPDVEMDSVSAFFDIPPSPPLSIASAISKQATIKSKPFRFPPGTTPAQAPTPLASSEIKKPLVVNNHSDSEFESEFDDARDRISDDVDPDDRAKSIVSLSEEDESDHQLQRVQRKIRGVLPASWLRLDLKTQGKKAVAATTAARNSPSPTKQFSRPGVARPISSHGNHSTNRSRDLEINSSGESLSDHENSSVFETSSPGRPLESFVDDTYVLPEDHIADMEDNRVDWMLPTNPRKHSPKKAQKKRRNIHENNRNVQRHDQENSHSRKRASNIGRQPKISEHITSTPKSSRTPHGRVYPLRRSILDFTDVPKKDVPNFVRVARRTTKSRKDKGRHSPSRKFLRLATREDTTDVQTTLKEWQELSQPVLSKYNPKDHNATGSARPLNPRSGNARIHSATYYLSDEEGDENSLPVATHPTRLAPKKSENILDRLLLQLPLSKVRVPTAPKQFAKLNGSHSIKRVMKKGLLSSSVNPSAHIRPAMLEKLRTLETASRHHKPQRTILSGPTMPSIDQAQSRLKAFLESSIPSVTDPGLNPEWSQTLQSPPTQFIARDNPPRNRKTCPKQVDISASRYRQDSIPSLFPLDIEESQDQIGATLDDCQTLRGLGPFGTSYAITFGIEPIAPGRHFNECTFIGSGEFLKALQFQETRDLDLPPPHLSTIHLGETEFEWGAWNDTVSSQLGIVYNRLNQYIKTYQNNSGLDRHSELDIDVILLMQRSVVRYVTNGLYFLDPIDRCSFLQRFQGLLQDLLHNLQDSQHMIVNSLLSDHDSCKLYRKSHIQISMLNLVILHQLQLISVHASVRQSLAAELGSAIPAMAAQAVALSISSGLGKIREFLHASTGNMWNAEDVSQLCEVESIVLTHHVVRHQRNKTGAFWKIINDCMGSSGSRTMCHVRVLDEKWHQLLSLVPLMEINVSGLIENDRQFKETFDNWALVKELLGPVLDSYKLGSHAQDSTFNSYFRAVLSRCFMLINQWRWCRCESIILALFDFFGSINLGLLRNEASHGSPAFLGHLSDKIKLEIASEDRSFHIFLKTLGTGLRQMHGIYPDKKIRDIVFRMMPNHDRRHPREDAISENDLEALRNHHDLISVLYWASPTGFRPRLSVVQNLIDLGNSHKEACHISIRAWSNLVNYQVSTEEPVSNLEAFSKWYNEILSQILRQHFFARSQVESLVKISESAGGYIISRELQESTISGNQRHIEDLLGHALSSLQRVVGSTRKAEAAEKLLSTTIVQVFELFNVKQPRVNNVIIQALDVIVTFAKHVKCEDAVEDSQDYGDFSAFESELAGFMPVQKSALLSPSIYTSLYRLLSNCFGADTLPDDKLMLKLVQAWSWAAHLSVRSGQKVWADYIGLYGSESWASLGDTEQKRKFSVAFLATLMEEDQDVYRSHAQLIIKQWMGSLVERESLLKFQHQLTTNILNSDRDNDLFANLPFWVDPSTELFNISAVEFRERRQSLLSCLFSNMRESLNVSTYHNLPHRTTQKNEYIELLKHLMATMKHNYLELGNGSNVRGAYVDFVHTIVESLQQHCTDICPIDQFFTSPGAFPLPAKDPTYFVGRLRNYALRLNDAKTAKQLSSFIQPIFETAAADGQQQYLVAQLTAAMSNNPEKGDRGKPTLRMFVVQTILPAYIQLAINNPCMLLLVVPLLQALERVLKDIVDDLDGFNIGSVSATQTTILSIFECLKCSSYEMLSHTDSFKEPLSIRALGFYFSIIQAALPAIDYIDRLRSESRLPRYYISYFEELAQHVTATILGQDPILPTVVENHTMSAPDEQVKVALAFALAELKQSLHKKWSVHDGHLYFTKNRTPALVQVDVGTLEEEKGNLLKRVKGFQEVLQSMSWLSDDEALVSRQEVPLGLTDLVF